jgi:hypothetical protein
MEISPERRPWVFRLVALVLLLGALELASFVVLGLIDRRLGLKVLSFPKDRAYYRAILPRLGFDADTGWDGLPFVRGAAPRRGERVFASAYGDSFTYGHNVTDAETFEAIFEARTGRRMLNFAVSGTGPDQALLKLRKHGASYPSEVVLLGIFPENIQRLGAVVQGYYFSGYPFPHTKPRFLLGPDGRIDFLRNPFRAAAEIPRLSDPDLLARISVHDHWYQLKRKRYGFDQARGRRPPFLLEAGRLLVGQILHGGGPRTYKDYYAPGGAGLGPAFELYPLLLHVVDELHRISRERGFVPVILLHCGINELPSMDRFLDGFVAAVRRKGVRLLRVCEAFRRRTGPRRLDPEALYQRPLGNFHYSTVGNRVVAEELETFLSSQGLLAPGPRP